MSLHLYFKMAYKGEQKITPNSFLLYKVVFHFRDKILFDCYGYFFFAAVLLDLQPASLVSN